MEVRGESTHRRVHLGLGSGRGTFRGDLLRGCRGSSGLGGLLLLASTLLLPLLELPAWCQRVSISIGTGPEP